MGRVRASCGVVGRDTDVRFSRTTRLIDRKLQICGEGSSGRAHRIGMKPYTYLKTTPIRRWMIYGHRDRARGAITWSWRAWQGQKALRYRELTVRCVVATR